MVIFFFTLYKNTNKEFNLNYFVFILIAVIPITIYGNQLFKCEGKEGIIFTDKPCEKNNTETSFQYKSTKKKSILEQMEESKRQSKEKVDIWREAESQHLDLIYNNMKKIHLGMVVSKFLDLFPVPKHPNLAGRIPSGRYDSTLLRVNRTKRISGISEQWIYGEGSYAKYYYFKNGILRTIQD